MPTFAAAGAIGFYGLSRLPRKPVDVYFVARALIALTLIFTLLDVIRDTVRTNTLPYLMGYTDKASYVARNAIPGQASYVAAMQELGRLPEGSQVRMMWETRTYYCPDNVTCTGDILFDHWARALRGGQTADEAFEGWKAAGDDYLLVFNLGYDFHVQDSRFPENADFPETLEQWMSPIWSDEAGVYTLYGWRD
jgi:hypothetical protein